jgi:hypothetical protein
MQNRTTLVLGNNNIEFLLLVSLHFALSADRDALLSILLTSNNRMVTTPRTLLEL